MFSWNSAVPDCNDEESTCPALSLITSVLIYLAYWLHFFMTTVPHRQVSCICSSSAPHSMALPVTLALQEMHCNPLLFE